MSRYKTGEFIPTDLKLEEMQKGREKKSTSLTRRMTTANFSKKREKQNLFQKKRKVMRNIEKHKCEISKGKICISL